MDSKTLSPPQSLELGHTVIIVVTSDQSHGANSANITVLYLESLQILSTTKKWSRNLKYSPN